MPNLVNDLLGKAGCTLDSVIKAIDGESVNNIKLNQKGGKKLLKLLKEENDIRKIVTILAFFSKSNVIINQLVNLDTILPSILDHLLSKAITVVNDIQLCQKCLIVIYDFINQSNKLKSLLCMSIHEYILTGIQEKIINENLLAKCMELLVSTITHHQENRTFFIKNTPKEKISAVFNLTKTTGNPMVQILTIEFLWRIAIPMRISMDEKNKIFGSYGKLLYSITPDHFREGVLSFVDYVNKDRTDEQKIDHLKVKNLMIGNNPATGVHNIYFGSKTILLWVNKNEKFAEDLVNVELITLQSNDVSGIGCDDKTWYIGLTKEFDTLLDFFENTERGISFVPINPSSNIFETLQKRFLGISSVKIPEPKSFFKNHIQKTPNIQSKTTPKEYVKTKNKSSTPKTPKVTFEKSQKLSIDDQKDIDDDDISFFMETSEESDDNYSDKSKDDKTKSTNTPKIKNNKNPMNQSPNTTNKKSKTPQSNKQSPKRINHSPSKPPTKKKIEKDNTNKSEKNSSKLKKFEKRKNESSDLEDDVQEIENPPNQVNDDTIPPVNIECSYNNDSNENSFSFEDSSEPEPRANEENEKNNNNTQMNIIAETLIPSTSDQNRSKMVIAPGTRKEYTPERWELDTFDELKNFSNSIRSQLSEKQTMLNRVIEDTVSKALEDVMDFMIACDDDLDKLQSDFSKASSTIMKDIEQKQNMVQQLGDQQTEHIQQMLHDCELLQKRATELIKRFAQQKKNLLANQEKHISLFREDMKSEVRAAVTSKKRETNKRLVQNLVNLLDEL